MPERHVKLIKELRGMLDNISGNADETCEIAGIIEKVAGLTEIHREFTAQKMSVLHKALRKEETTPSMYDQPDSIGKLEDQHSELVEKMGETTVEMLDACYVNGEAISLTSDLLALCARSMKMQSEIIQAEHKFLIDRTAHFKKDPE